MKWKKLRITNLPPSNSGIYTKIIKKLRTIPKASLHTLRLIFQVHNSKYKNKKKK